MQHPLSITIGEASRRSGWSPRMLRYLEEEGLVVPGRTASGYRRYGIRELNQLHALAELRRGHGVELNELTFALRLRREPELRGAVETWLAGTSVSGSEQVTPAWVEWEQRKHERLLASQAA
jgi:MerR family transcriptional regulator, copper efflux regulator